MKEICKIIFLTIVACLCPWAMQAQGVKSLRSEPLKADVKTISLDTISNVPLPEEEYVPSRPTLGGFPVLQGSSYYSESKEPWIGEDGKPLRISPNAIPHYETPTMQLGGLSAYSAGVDVPGVMFPF